MSEWLSNFQHILDDVKLKQVLTKLSQLDLSDAITQKIILGITASISASLFALYLFFKRSKPNKSIPIYIDNTSTRYHCNFYPYFGHYFFLRHMKSLQTYNPNNIQYEHIYAGLINRTDVHKPVIKVDILDYDYDLVQLSSLSAENTLMPLDVQILQQLFGHSRHNQNLLSINHNSNNKKQNLYFKELLPSTDTSCAKRARSRSASINYKHMGNNELVSLAFQKKELQLHMFDCVYQSVGQLITKLENLRTDGNRINITQLSQNLCWNIFFNIFVGKQISLNFLDLYPKQHVIQSTFTQIVQIMENRPHSWFWKLFRFFGLGSEKDLALGIQTLNRNLYSIIDIGRLLVDAQQKTETLDVAQRSDLLSLLIFFSTNGNGNKTRKQKFREKTAANKKIRNVLISLLYSSIEPTKLLIDWLIYELCRHPNIANKIVTEIDYFFEHESRLDFSTIIGDDENSYFPLLDAFIYETLRLHPSQINLRYECLNTFEVDSNLNVTDTSKYVIQKKDQIYINTYVYARLPYIWGPDCNKFNPFRFFNSQTQTQTQAGFEGNAQSVNHPLNNPLKYILFGVHPHSYCLGRYIALMVAKIVIVQLLKAYDLQWADKKRKKQKMKYKIGDWLRMEKDLIVKLFKKNIV